jgi:8-oxo-dGTP pyrophosphatase MutT (NUDIX family)
MGGGLRSEEGRDGRRQLSNPRDFVIPFDRLPENFAQSIEEPVTAPAAPRPAATIVLLRDSDEGMEVLLMKRSRSAGFVPGAYVFPGGRVDGSDAQPDLLERLDHLSHRAAGERLALVDQDPPAIAYYLAALREAFEETGILFGVLSDGSAPPTAAEDPAIDSMREALMNDEISFAQAISSLDCRIDGHSIEYIAHWITPLAEPRRYDTRFFAAKVGAGSTPIIDPREMTDAIWLDPSEALRRCDDGRLPMVFPTIRTIEGLARYTTADAALEGFRGSEVRTILPRLVVTPTGVGLEIEDEG